MVGFNISGVGSSGSAAMELK